MSSCSKSKNIERDAEEFVKRFRPIGMEKLRFILEDLVRSYNPCLSCAVSLDVYRYRYRGGKK